MKKNILLAAAALLLCSVALAGPAKPGRITYTQPDGTTIGIYLHGDEYYHWMTDDNGDVVVGDQDGYIKKQGLDTPAARKQRIEQAKARREENQTLLQAAAASANNTGSPEIPVFLIGFSDKAFTKTAAQFDAMLNTPGYSDNNAIGSVYDYYNENSFGKFTPHFDVLGPVTLSNKLSAYGSDENYAYKALVDACTMLDSSVDFSKYDNDGDGYVDFAIFYFAGYDEAQCPQTGAYTNNIWSHASDIRSLRKRFDNVYLSKYFCTAELKGYTGSTMCSIGTTCHEFAHTLGLPDFYDTDYEENGESANTYDFDLMSSGSYNNNSTTPPYLNAEELVEVGWLSSIPELTTTGSQTLPAVNYPGASSYSAFMTKTTNSNEYFVYEVRRGERWDAAIPAGMLVYHIDKSSTKVTGQTTAASLWNSNELNCYSTHPCCYIVPANNPTSTAEYTGSLQNMVFPGNGRVKTFSPVAWNGNNTGFQLTGITYSNGVVTFNVENSNKLGIIGAVVDSDGNPIAGATMTLEVSAASSSVRKNDKGLVPSVSRLFSLFRKQAAPRTKAATSLSTTTNSDGEYSFDLEEAGNYAVTAAKEGYVSQTIIVSVTSVIESQNFFLLREGEELPSSIIPFPQDEDAYIVGTSINTITGQNMFPVSEMSKYAGKQIKSISFYLAGDSDTTFDDVYAILDYDNTRKATVRINDDEVAVNGWTTVDLRDQELIISEKEDLYAGVGVKNWSYSETQNGTTYYYPFVVNYLTEEDEDGNEYVPEWADGWPYKGFVSELDLTSTGTRYDWELVFWIYLTVGDYNPSDTGYNFIEDPQEGNYSAGDVLYLNLIETEDDRQPGSAIEWFFDDEPVSGSVTLPSGSHTVEARFTTKGGNKKVVELELKVN